ncbi:hypothetical protein SBRY_50119 [Actinacidiphila bryophytorum]|uniref:Uncharacterized protein n=1 Tax=Actinacidiphila bryophytorum TaxID=1436133 RepID=A0A9W4H4B0_9ACTN|nr:hypothetical protein SBRY_50119 [Actinacidiphila bryophytorum]
MVMQSPCVDASSSETPHSAFRTPRRGDAGIPVNSFRRPPELIPIIDLRHPYTSCTQILAP